jgi:hypothetical protein
MGVDVKRHVRTLVIPGDGVLADCLRFPHPDLALAVVIEFLAGDLTADELDSELHRYAGLA